MKKIFNISALTYSILIMLFFSIIIIFEENIFTTKSDIKINMLITGFFWIWGILMMLIVKKAIDKKPVRVANIYLLLKTVKNIISGIIAVFIFFKISENRTGYLIVFGVLYLINLLSETLYVYLTEKNNKELINQ